MRAIRVASDRLDAWVESEGFAGWDPHDALNSPLVQRLTFGNRLLGIAWLQLLKRSPLNVRPLLGVRKGYNPKGMGLFMDSYLRKYEAGGGTQHAERVRFFADWLVRHRSEGHSGFCWGYNFDWPNRSFYAPAGTPTIVNTAFIAMAFLRAHRMGQMSPVPDALLVARSACDYVLRDLHQERPAPDELYFSYTPLDRRCVHNASLLGAQLLAEVYAETGERELAETALAAARFSARRQQTDGSWAYGTGRSDSWVDNFHTGYVLVSLKSIGARLGTDEFAPIVKRGYQFWKRRMFTPDGAPKYYPDVLYPIDAHCVAQTILTFLAFEGDDGEALQLAVRTARWGIEHMQDARGHFHYQVYRRYRITTPYMRWTQAWMQRSLTELLAVHFYGNNTLSAER